MTLFNTNPTVRPKKYSPEPTEWNTKNQISPVLTANLTPQGYQPGPSHLRQGRTGKYFNKQTRKYFTVLPGCCHYFPILTRRFSPPI